MKEKLIRLYKGLMITSYVLVIASFSFLSFYPYYLTDSIFVERRSIAISFLIAGVVLFLIAELWHNLVCVSTGLLKKEYLKASIVYSGLGMCIISFMFLIFNLFTYSVSLSDYKPFICILGVALFIAYMILQKRRLRKQGVKISKTVSVISISIVALVVISLLLTNYCFEFIVYDSLFKDISIISETRAYAELYSIGVARERSLMYIFIISTSPLFIAVLMNYIEMLVKAKRFKAVD